MRLTPRIALFLLLCLPASTTLGQARVEGQVYSMLYAWENLNASQQWDTYQGARLQVRPSQKTNLSFKTHLRLARRGDPAEWDERIYNAYVDWQSTGRRYQARLGRQFVYRGVLNGSLDALSLQARPAPGLDLQVVAGVATPYDRPLDVAGWKDGGVLGSYAAYRFAPEARVDVSYVQRIRQDQVAWRQVGTSLSGTLQEHFFYQAQLEYNLLQSTYQGMRYRLTYQDERWAVTGEYNTQKPRIYEDSFFNVFRLIAFNQLRGGVTVQAGSYQIGGQYLHTIYEGEETNDAVILTVGRRWGTLGVVYQNGFGGDNIGLYGDVRYDVFDNLTLRLHSSYYQYQRRNIAVDEDATAFSGGILYRPVPALMVQAELQESLNSFYSQNLRALLRVSYAFDMKRR